MNDSMIGNKQLLTCLNGFPVYPGDKVYNIPGEKL